ncbi:hypothetical protein UCRPC4_g05633 [Phaeomoniella chlamydospora]|uniref:Uncharacterized protein n=1 Tax=Phaeomoniella chlamydospora TaxID=158046 RepID=A0A0G2E3U3_PHACM|nr:hypothetical protein UCRPC4_g05633 [Phaeomoniella chlamydospora]
MVLRHFHPQWDTGSPGNEEAILEDNDNSGQSNTTPTSPFARRVSFGAQAYGNVRSSRGSFSNGDGFKWGDNLREKSGRPGPNASPTAGRSGSPPAPQQHQRAAGIAHVEPPKQMSAQPVHYAKPDVLGERMLRGDFMMD